ncbi:hypothetical protein [Veillonella sp.]|uniref:hypothetical protein n=1 Tax=Veillonella sp. TaxID=1926307 RepID=UPI0025E2F597|nr:hypothetical protein [Veillonella sp.]
MLITKTFLIAYYYLHYKLLLLFLICILLMYYQSFFTVIFYHILTQGVIIINQDNGYTLSYPINFTATPICLGNDMATGSDVVNSQFLSFGNAGTSKVIVSSIHGSGAQGKLYGRCLFIGI